MKPVGSRNVREERVRERETTNDRKSVRVKEREKMWKLRGKMRA